MYAIDQFHFIFIDTAIRQGHLNKVIDMLKALLKDYQEEHNPN